MQKYANRIFRKKEYSLLAQVPISVADLMHLRFVTMKVLNSYENSMKTQIYENAMIKAARRAKMYNRSLAGHWFKMIL